jgi:lipopolysaccharide heptosyltransferase I
MQKVLIIKPSSLGDVIHTFPIVTAMAEQIPGVTIDWVVRPEYADLVSAHPVVREVLLFDRKKWSSFGRLFKTLLEVWHLGRSLRSERYDAALDLQGLFRSGLMTYVSGAPLRMGFANAREHAPLFYNRKISVPQERMHAIDRYLLFLNELGLQQREPQYGLLVPAASERKIARILEEEKIESGKPLVVLNPSTRWETKKWFVERFAALADRLADKLKACVIAVGGPSEREETPKIQSRMHSRLIDLAGRTSLLELAALLRRADLMVTCDSGPMHLAAAVETPVVALFGPTDPVRTGPFGPGHRVIQKGLECAGCLERTCPDNGRACMEAISVEEVFEAVSGLLSEKQRTDASRPVHGL